MRRLLSALGLLLLCALPASAQTGITAHTFRQYQPGAQAPVVAPFTIQHAAVTCNAAVPATAKTLVWDDPDTAGRVCFWADPGTGPLFAKVYGALEATLTNLAGALESPESARVPFSRAPAAPTGLNIK
jgi:hypothetical protein